MKHACPVSYMVGPSDGLVALPQVPPPGLIDGFQLRKSVRQFCCLPANIGRQA